MRSDTVVFAAGLAAVAAADRLTVTQTEDVTVTYCAPSVTNCIVNGNPWATYNAPAPATTAWSGIGYGQGSSGHGSYGQGSYGPPAGWHEWDYSQGNKPANWDDWKYGSYDGEWSDSPSPPAGWYEWDYSKGSKPAHWDDWKQGSSGYNGDDDEDWSSYPSPPAGWHEWDYAQDGNKPAHWDDWKQGWNKGGKTVVTITLVEHYSVPCPTGWKDEVTTIYVPHCGCTETPVPDHPSYKTITTECPDEWGVGKTVTYTVPEQTQWAGWDNGNGGKPTGVADADWAKWTATASVTAACPKYTAAGPPDWFKQLPADAAKSMGDKWAKGAPDDWCYYSWSTVPAMQSTWAAADVWSTAAVPVKPTASSQWANVDVKPTGAKPAMATWTGAANSNAGSVAMAGLAGLAAIILA